jgi:hypothetical protein
MPIEQLPWKMGISCVENETGVDEVPGPHGDAFVPYDPGEPEVAPLMLPLVLAELPDSVPATEPVPLAPLPAPSPQSQASKPVPASTAPVGTPAGAPLVPLAPSLAVVRPPQPIASNAIDAAKRNAPRLHRLIP